MPQGKTSFSDRERSAQRERTAFGMMGGPDIGEIAKLNQRSFETIAHAHSRMLRDSLRFQAELLDFARRRLGVDIETQDRLVHCRTVNDAVGVMNEFCQGAVRDYSSEAAELVTLCVGMATESAGEAMAEARSGGEAEAAAGGNGHAARAGRAGARHMRGEGDETHGA